MLPAKKPKKLKKQKHYCNKSNKDFNNNNKNHNVLLCSTVCVQSSALAPNLSEYS